MAKVNLLGMPRAKLAAFFETLGEKPYRANQLMNWVYRAGVDDFNAMTNIAKPLRARLDAVAEIRLPGFVSERRAGDGVVKWLASVQGGQAVETVLIPDAPAERGSPVAAPEEAPDDASRLTGKRLTLCISSQVGCALDCSFCATGKEGWGGNLDRAEIVGQALLAQRAVAARGGAITNIVFMGMGEPLLNFDAVMDAADVFMDDLAFGISKRRVTVSTAGVVPRIYDMAARSDISLAVSLHAADDAKRNVLVPINRKYPIADLLAACRHYLGTLGTRRSVTFEYTLIAGVNDSVADAQALARLLADWRCKINLIPFNPFPTDPAAHKRPSEVAVAQFQTVLRGAGCRAMRRATRGDAIDAACGQLTGNFADRTRRRARHAARIELLAAEAAA